MSRLILITIFVIFFQLFKCDNIELYVPKTSNTTLSSEQAVNASNIKSIVWWKEDNKIVGVLLLFLNILITQTIDANYDEDKRKVANKIMNSTLENVITAKTQTLIIIILDESGSMDTTKEDVIGGFNSFIREQKKIKDDVARLYLVKFNTYVTAVHTGIPLIETPELSTTNYNPSGFTALYDAIAEAVSIADKEKTKEERVICVIITDGEENSSRETTKEQVKNIISGHEAIGDWTFLYIGENPDKWAEDTGMSATHAIQYNAFVDLSYDMANRAVERFRQQSNARVNTSLFDN